MESLDFAALHTAGVRSLSDHALIVIQSHSLDRVRQRMVQRFTRMMVGFLEHIGREVTQEIGNGRPGDLEIRSAVLTQAANLVTRLVQGSLDIGGVVWLAGQKLVLDMELNTQRRGRRRPYGVDRRRGAIDPE